MPPRLKKRASKVRCPHCLHWDSDVGQGFEDIYGRGYSRRRKCASCRRDYYTIETVDAMRAVRRKPGRKPADDFA